MFEDGMSLREEISNLYSEIDVWQGDFGDPVIDAFSFDPWVNVDRADLSKFEMRGVLVAILVFVSTAIDNSTFEAAIASKIGQNALKLREKVGLDEYRLFRNSLSAMDESEDAFNASLRDIYLEWVKPTLQ